MSPPRLSIVVPAYNEAPRLPRTLRRLREWSRAAGESPELVVVDDGSTDATAEVARAEGGESLVLLRHQANLGKGAAVRRGMLAASGRRRLMTDADLSTPIEELPRLERELDEGADIAIGSRAIAGARIEVRQSIARESMGRLFNALVQLMLLPGLQDTQCGFKLFTDEAAGLTFSVGRLDGFSFDVEALYVARRRGLKVTEVPVVWRNDTATRVSLVGGGAAFFDLFRIRALALRGAYDPPASSRT